IASICLHDSPHTHVLLSPFLPPLPPPFSTSFFFFNDPATPEIYTLSLHDALPICRRPGRSPAPRSGRRHRSRAAAPSPPDRPRRSEEHTSELQSLTNLVCRLLLEKKKKNTTRS